MRFFLLCASFRLYLSIQLKCCPSNDFGHVQLLLPFFVQDTQGMDLQMFFDVLQRTAEELGLLAADDESLDDWVPLRVLRQLMTGIVGGMQKVACACEC